MAKKRKKQEFDAIAFKRMIVTGSRCFDAEGDPRLGFLVIDTMGGLHQLFVTEATAAELIQELRDFLAEEAERMP